MASFAETPGLGALRSVFARLSERDDQIQRHIMARGLPHVGAGNFDRSGALLEIALPRSRGVMRDDRATQMIRLGVATALAAEPTPEVIMPGRASPMSLRDESGTASTANHF